MTKRLSKGKFQGWPKNNALLNPIAAKYLRQLLLGDKSALSWEKLAATDKESSRVRLLPHPSHRTVHTDLVYGSCNLLFLIS
jgi:hypothetical protein